MSRICWAGLIVAGAAITAHAQDTSQYACTEQGGIAAARYDDSQPKLTRSGWAPRTWMAWCRKCGGSVTNGRCVGARLTGAGATSGGAQTAEQAAVDAAQRVMSAGNFNTPNNAAMTIGAATATAVGVAALRSLFEGPTPQQRAQAEQARQERLRLQREAEERARQEQQRRHLALLSNLRRDGGSDGGLGLRREGGGTGGDLDLIRRETPPSGAAIAPFPQNDPALRGTGNNLALIRRGDAAEPGQPLAAQQLLSAAGHAQNAATLGGESALQGARSEAGQVFDGGGLRIGAAPPAPPEAQGRPVGGLQLDDLVNAKPGDKFKRTEVARVLDDALNTYGTAAETSRKELARLEGEPKPDAAKIHAERERLERIENERRAIEEKKKKVDDAKEEMIEFTIGEAEVGAK